MTSQEARERLEAMASGVSFDDRDEMDMFRQILKDIAELEAALASAVCHGCGHKTINDKGVAVHWCEECVAEKLHEVEAENKLLKAQADATITRSITGEGEPCRYGSVTEMQADFARKRIAELEAALAQSQADAAAMMEALLLLPDGRAGSKTGRADYVAMVGGDVLLKCWQAAQDHAGQPLLDELARLREALEPFSDYAGILDDAGAPDCCPIRTDPASVTGGRPTASDCRAARAALAAPSLTQEQRAAKQAWIDDDDMPLREHE